MNKYTECLNNGCFFTQTPKEYCEIHHIFGAADRKKSEKWGMKVYLTPLYHRLTPFGVHIKASNSLLVKQYAQREFEAIHGHDKFMKTFGKNYL